MTETLSIKISSEEKSRLKAISQARGTSISSLIRESVRRVLDESAPEESPTLYDRFHHLFEEPGHIGSSGLGDLSTNKKHLEGFGK